MSPANRHISIADLPQVARDNPWFSSLSASHQRKLIESAKLVPLRDKQYACIQHQSVRRWGDGFALLLEGSLRVSSCGFSGKEAILTHIQPGQWFGELAMLDGHARERDVRSVGESQLLLMDKLHFAQLMQDRVFAESVVRLLSSRTRMLLDLVEDFSLYSTRARFARRLVMLARNDDPLSQPTQKELPFSHDTLASMMGTTRQALSSQLKALSDVGAIAQSYGRITIESIVLLMAEAAAN